MIQDTIAWAGALKISSSFGYCRLDKKLNLYMAWTLAETAQGQENLKAKPPMSGVDIPPICLCWKSHWQYWVLPRRAFISCYKHKACFNSQASSVTKWQLCSPISFEASSSRAMLPTNWVSYTLPRIFSRNVKSKESGVESSRWNFQICWKAFWLNCTPRASLLLENVVLMLSVNCLLPVALTPSLYTNSRILADLKSYSIEIHENKILLRVNSRAYL